MDKEPSKTTREFLLAQVKEDPGLPRPQPTTSFWQVPPHATLADKQSPQLPASTDIAIIGSGITGCSVAKNILDISSRSAGSDAVTVTVFEARTLVSGATGRNGGLLTSFVPEEFADLAEHYGAEEAVKIARFAKRSLDKVHELANASPERKERSQVRPLRDVVCFSDPGDFAEAKRSWRLYEEHIPEDRGKTEFLSPAEAAQKYNVRATAGALTFPNGAGWPYRLITDVWSQLYEQYQSRFSIETKTPVENITYEASDAVYPYTLHTPRGVVRAAKVIHATNGYAGHLLPALRGSIYPLRGSMSVQRGTPEFGRHGSSRTWSMTNKRTYEPETDVLEAGTYYAHQNAITGDMFIGGEKTKASAFFVADDSEVNAHCRANFATLLPRYFIRGWDEGGGGPEMRAMWTGIMGFTGDRLPLVGPLPASATRQRGGDGEWIAAGFNGYGMSLCWACGEAVARMVLGMDVADWLPAAFLATRERIEQPAQRGALNAVLELLDA
ncbi:FAD dependent oxidoreductase [Cordyceps militaris]|uniref:FAD dependent oxidoreductase n=1 Tax=Cordyceps militaris TaxID=73501 RepID=A0A2H4SF03_CORMI|nr:FAD dependent oxidoreductase [Cordyceps militaris]